MDEVTKALEEERDFLRHDEVVWQNNGHAWIVFNAERDPNDGLSLPDAIKKFAADNPHLVKAPVDEPDE